ncbi:hypothetical protein AN639_02370 [Candidatus Epulonipiscium fishelsonii]|uniref:Uncharacterized protein n=1 Tax=Candidatus Epulonipiscium fishelsonii TaxID=77094 RepID=A0ACC8X9D2_9FIRM|nr:hypothetical protein AN396_09805 [Epulopiscium sp. SCG-B11WGA-EpuloA1]ONI42288.1 hypothetical protein AN639_02370 [Epulopiscium sp. SCG-B05WGA-EpuloA1]
MLRIKKYICSILALVLVIGCFGMPTLAQNVGVEGYLPELIREADEFKLIENGDRKSIAYIVQDNIKIYVEWDRHTNEVQLVETNMLTRSVTNNTNFTMEISENIEASYTMELNDQIYHVNNSKIESRTAMTLVLLLGQTLIDYLISIAATLTIGDMLCTLAKDVIDELSNKKNKFKHYRAFLQKFYADDGKNIAIHKLYIGDPLADTNVAAVYLLEGNVWSTSQKNAKAVAAKASPPGTELKPHPPHKWAFFGDEYYPHYHRYNYDGGNPHKEHSFYGESIPH